ncbi:MAG: glycosyltransferase, partial [Bacteroidota bacterium]|nr:glycosyltransferase [Bacteroidota bacterium]
DNSPHPSPFSSKNVTYRHDPLNHGVSTAYNTASVYAESKHKNWMLFLDQDTTVTVNFFEELLAAIDAHRETVAFVPRLSDQKGVVSPFYFAFGRGKRINTEPSPLSLSRHRFINSGLLVKLSAFRAVGGYDPEIPLDFSDISFGMRLMAITDHFWVLETILSHDFSDNSNMEQEDALLRFRRYCVGASVMGRKSRLPNFYAIQSLLRACHLSMRYKSGHFVTAFFQHFFNG